MKIFSLIATVSLFLTACGGSSSTHYPLPTTAIEIPFVAIAGSAANNEVSCGKTHEGIGSGLVDGEFNSFAFFIHDMKLITSNDEEVDVVLDNNDWQAEGVALLDFQNSVDCLGISSKPTNKKVSGLVKTAALNGETITGIRFTLGVPSRLNHNDPTAAASPLNRNDMHWSWQNGYKHLRMDFNPSGEAPKWNIHLGSTGCTEDPQVGNSEVSCTAPNRPIVDLDLGHVDLKTAAVQFNYGTLVENSDVSVNTVDTKSGCMSHPLDPECSEVFDALGLGLGQAADPAPGQTVFSIIDTAS